MLGEGEGQGPSASKSEMIGLTWLMVRDQPMVSLSPALSVISQWERQLASTIDSNLASEKYTNPISQ